MERFLARRPRRRRVRRPERRRPVLPAVQRAADAQLPGGHPVLILMRRPMAKRHTVQRLVRASGVIPVLLILGVGACQAFLDVNQNPNAPENAAVEVRLPALITEFIHSTYYGENALWGA